MFTATNRIVGRDAAPALASACVVLLTLDERLDRRRQPDLVTEFLPAPAVRAGLHDAFRLLLQEAQRLRAAEGSAKRNGSVRRREKLRFAKNANLGCPLSRCRGLTAARRNVAEDGVHPVKLEGAGQFVLPVHDELMYRQKQSRRTLRSSKGQARLDRLLDRESSRAELAGRVCDAFGFRDACERLR